MAHVGCVSYIGVALLHLVLCDVRCATRMYGTHRRPESRYESQPQRRGSSRSAGTERCFATLVAKRKIAVVRLGECTSLENISVLTRPLTKLECADIDILLLCRLKGRTTRATTSLSMRPSIPARVAAIARGINIRCHSPPRGCCTSSTKSKDQEPRPANRHASKSTTARCCF